MKFSLLMDHGQDEHECYLENLLLSFVEKFFRVVWLLGQPRVRSGFLRAPAHIPIAGVAPTSGPIILKSNSLTKVLFMYKAVAIVITILSLSACVSTRNVPLEAKTIELTGPRSITIPDREKPNFTAVTAGKAMFGLIGASAMVSKGNQIVRENNIEDPAQEMALRLSEMLAAEYGIDAIHDVEMLTDAQSVNDLLNEFPEADLLVDVQTINWSFGYFPTDWNNYRVMYSAKLRMVDVGSGDVLAEGFCAQVPEYNEDAPKHEELLRNSAKELKLRLKSHAETCTRQFARDILRLDSNPDPDPDPGSDKGDTKDIHSSL